MSPANQERAWPPPHEHGEFAKARAQAECQALILRERAVRTIAYQAVDVEDCRRLLSMLGLDGDVRSRGG
jgi:hypothetical protein